MILVTGIICIRNGDVELHFFSCLLVFQSLHSWHALKLSLLQKYCENVHFENWKKLFSSVIYHKIISIYFNEEKLLTKKLSCYIFFVEDCLTFPLSPNTPNPCPTNWPLSRLISGTEIWAVVAACDSTQTTPNTSPLKLLSKPNPFPRSTSTGTHVKIKTITYIKTMNKKGVSWRVLLTTWFMQSFNENKL